MDRSKLREKELREIVKKLFDYEFKKTGNLLYFKSKRIHTYLNECFIYHLPWKSLSGEELIKLKNSWNEVFG